MAADIVLKQPFSAVFRDPSNHDNEEIVIMQNNLKKTEDNKGSTSGQTIISLLKGTLKQFYNRELPLDHLVFLYTAAAGILMSVFGLGYNLLRGIGRFTLPVLILYLAVTISSVFYSVVKKRWHGAAVIVLGTSVFFLIPFLWFTVGGATGSTAPMMLTGGICIAIVFRGAVRTGMLVMEAIMLIAFVVLEYNFPDIVIPYISRT